MQSSIAILSALAALAMASPVDRRMGKSAFTVPQVEAGVVVKSAPAISMLKTYAKYSSAGAVAPAAVKAAAAAAQSGTVAASPESVRTFLLPRHNHSLMLSVGYVLPLPCICWRANAQPRLRHWKC